MVQRSERSAELSYEAALQRLEKVVEELDRSGLELESRLALFEEGTKLARVLLKKLEQAKHKVELLVKTNVGELAFVPFDEERRDDTSASA